MIENHESDPEAEREVHELVDDDVFALLAAVSKKYDVTISVYIAPNGDVATRDPNDS